MSSGLDETVDVKEVGNEADGNGNGNGNGNVNMSDELIKEEDEGTLPPLPGNQETLESIENGEVKSVGVGEVAEEEVVIEAKEENEEQIPAGKSQEIPNVGSGEMAGDDDSGRVNEAEEDVNTEEIPIGEVTNDVDMIAKENEGIVDEGANNAGVDARENEEEQTNVLKEAKIENYDEARDYKSEKALGDVVNESLNRHIDEELGEPKLEGELENVMNTPGKSFLDGYESGTEEEQAEFAKEVKTFYRENNLEYKPPKFYKEELNLLKLWRAVIKLGGYEQVTSTKLWRQVGESFRPPKTCTTVSWTFRIFYEKALLEYEKHKMRNGELPFSDDSLVEPVRVENQVPGSQALGSGRARRDAAARAMQGWHSQRLLGNGEEKNLNSAVKGDKQIKTNGLLKRKKPPSMERGVNVQPLKSMRMDSMVVDVGPPADWVKINVQKTSDCFEIYALVPGLLREEVHVQSDPAGRLIISGEPEQLDNPWGVTAFKKVVTLPSRIDPHQTSAVVTLHGQLFVRVPFEQLDS